MDWKTWYSKRRWAAGLSIFIVILSVFWLTLIGPSNQPAPATMVKQIRVLTNPIVHTLEHKHAESLLSDQRLQRKLTEWTQESQVDLQVVLPDGTIVFDGENPPKPRINPRFELDYTLRISDSEPPRYHLAFPLRDAGSHTLTGYAQFSVPASVVASGLPSSDAYSYVPWIMLALALGTLLYLFFSVGRRVQHELVEPIAGLKPYTEAIMRGDYEQRAEWTNDNEVGELYAVFDLMREELRNLHIRQTAHNQSHKELITNLSHDLKTPLSTIKAYIEAIREGICPDLPSAMTYLEVVHANASRMSVLVDDLLLHALRDLGQIAVQPVEKYSAPALKPIFSAMAHYIRTLGISCEVPADIPNLLVRMDSVRIEQVVANLVTNALKHTEPGDTIRLAVEEEPETSSLHIIVSDTGSGISPEDMPFIFERYYQGNASQRTSGQLAERSGVGLGLSICKYIMEAHGGTISFYSQRQQGTTFCLTLPL